MKLCEKILNQFVGGNYIHQYFLDDSDKIQTIQKNIKAISIRNGAPIPILKRDKIELLFDEDESITLICKDFLSPTITNNFEIILKSKDKDFGEITLQPNPSNSRIII
jgi:hypothetical protein